MNICWLLVSLVSSEAPSSSDTCLLFSETCESCMGNGGAHSCGWCKDNGHCLSGTESGPNNMTCIDWTFKFNMKCHLESTEPLPIGTRIAIAVTSSIIALVTAVFWICIFPSCTAKPKIDTANSDD